MKHFLTGIILMIASAVNAQETGASFAFTSEEPVVKQAMTLLNEGKFSDAEKLLNHSGPSRDREECKEVIRRLRREYSLDEKVLLVKLQKSIPDVTLADLARWRDAGQVQYRMIDGQVRYFRREPSNIFRFCDEAKQRARKQGNPDKVPSTLLLEHLANVVDAGEKSVSPLVCPMQHRIIYRVEVPAASGLQPAGPSILKIWLPFPQEYRQQTNVKLLRSQMKVGTDEVRIDPVIAPNAIDGPIVQHAQRTAYFEIRNQQTPQTVSAEIEFEYTSHAYYPKLRDEEAQPLPADWGDAYLAERLPHIAFSEAMRNQVRQIVGDETNPLKKLRKIYYWCDENIRYHAEEEYCVLPSFSLKCFERKRGDCGVQSTLFVAMCRIAGIPARWQSGWESKPSGYNMHDWCEVYIAPWGWLPCDVSYGLQKSDDPRIREFYIGHQDSYRMIVNLDYGRQLEPPKKSLRSEPADFQRGEVEINGRNLYFDEFNYSIRIFIDGKELKGE